MAAGTELAPRLHLDESRLSHLVGYAASRAAIVLRRMFVRHLGPLDLKVVDFSILVLVGSNDQVNQTQLGQALDVSPPNMAVTIDRLVERGWVERVRSTQDRRAMHIHLTASGDELLQRAERIAVTMENPALRRLSAAERALLIELLAKVTSRQDATTRHVTRPTLTHVPMRTRHHPLQGTPLGTRRDIVSFHYGPTDTGRKVYVQASLHADELPGMLTAHHLRQRLAALEAEGRLRGEIVVVPVANPIGLGQTVLLTNEGRFDLASGDNFNRHYPALLAPLLPRLEGRLGTDAAANAATIRAAMREVVAALPAETELASQRKTLLGLACDAEVVLDLHCDCESLLHLYTGTALWPQAEALARYTGAHVSLLAAESGDHPFDEACSQTWWLLEAQIGQRHPVPMGCLAVTLELRGLADVDHRLAAADADALVAFFTHRGVIDGPAPALPALLNDATPLDGCDVLKAPVSGVVVYLRAVGERVRAGEVVLEVIEPLDGTSHPVASRTDGLLFARESLRYVRAGRSLCKVAGSVTVRSGKLSSD